MKSFEQCLGLEDSETRQAFAAACQDIFRSPSGRIVMARLCAARHPMSFPQGNTTDETLVANGQREVVATLFRFAQQTMTL
jgi:hypothetical protein